MFSVIYYEMCYTFVSIITVHDFGWSRRESNFNTKFD